MATTTAPAGAATALTTVITQTSTASRGARHLAASQRRRTADSEEHAVEGQARGERHRELFRPSRRSAASQRAGLLLADLRHEVGEHRVTVLGVAARSVEQNVRAIRPFALGTGLLLALAVPACPS